MELDYRESLDSKLSNLQKSSSYRLMGPDTSAKHEIQQKRGATAVCQQPLLTKLNTSLIMPVGTEHKIHKRPSSWNWITESCHSEMSSLQNSSYQTQGLNELYKSESQEKSDSGKTIEERPWLQWTPQWAHRLYGRSKTIDKNTIKNVSLLLINNANSYLRFIKSCMFLLLMVCVFVGSPGTW